MDKFLELAQTKLSHDSNHKLNVHTSSLGGSIQLDLSSDDRDMWVNNNFLVADIYHESHDVLVIILKFLQKDGRYISVHFGILPHVKTRLCLPLKALNGEKLFLDRYPGVLQTVLRGDSSIDRSRMSTFIVETPSSTQERNFEISNIHLRMEEPEFSYERQAYIDDLGQLKDKEWAGKIASIDALKIKLEKELQDFTTNPPVNEEIGTYGGWKKIKFESTGFFRTEYDGKNWWFVDPEGYATFSLGIDGMRVYSPMRVSGMEHLISNLPSKEGNYAAAWDNENFDYGIYNLIRVFGSDWYHKWSELNAARLKDWQVNTIANWSQEEFIKSAKMPYVYPMEDFPTTKMKIYRDFPDVFSTEYHENASLFAQQLKPLLNDRLLIGYFMRNEPHWAFVEDLNLTKVMLLQSQLSASKVKFIEMLLDKYVTIDRLNEAWETKYNTFYDLKNPDRILLNESSGQQADFAMFNRMLIRKYVEIPAKYCKEIDANHLNLGMRYAWIAHEDILEGCELFDVFSINSYQSSPDREQIERISKKLGIPVMIGEFHFGASDVGLPAYGIRATKTQHERGLAYRYYVEQAATIPGLIGVHYFQFNDQPVLGRFDGENYQIGVVDICQQPYQSFVEQMKLSHQNVYSIRSGETQPLAEPPKEIPKTGF